MMNTRKVFKADFSKGFAAVGPCKRCGKPADRFGGHQFAIGFKFCLRVLMAQKKETA